MRFNLSLKFLRYIALVLLIPGLLLLSTALPLTAMRGRPLPPQLNSDRVEPDRVESVEAGMSLNGQLFAQRIRPLEVWQQVYDLLPDLPREDQYISVETGQRATSSTLISRLIRYHTLLKGRSPNYRFDWKLTLADYLGANELMRSAGYPGHDTLTTHPMAADVAAIGRLNRAQRDALVQALVTVFTTSTDPSSPTPTTPPTSRPGTTPAPRPASGPLNPPTIQPRPGDAQHLQL